MALICLFQVGDRPVGQNPRDPGRDTRVPFRSISRPNAGQNREHPELSFLARSGVLERVDELRTVQVTADLKNPARLLLANGQDFFVQDELVGRDELIATTPFADHVILKTISKKNLSVNTGVRPAKVLLCQSVGFLAIIFVCLFDDLLGLSSLVFGDQSYIVDFRDFALKMLLILCVWLLVSGSTRRILAEAQHLAKFMKVCAWCRRIQFEGGWVPLERFLSLGFNKTTSHSICEECLQKAQAEIEDAKKAKVNPAGQEPDCPAQG